MESDQNKLIGCDNAPADESISEEARRAGDGFRELFNDVCSNLTLPTRGKAEKGGRLRVGASLPLGEDGVSVDFALEVSNDPNKDKSYLAVIGQNDGRFVAYSLEGGPNEGYTVERVSFEVETGEDGHKRIVNSSDGETVGVDEITRLTEHVHNRLDVKNSPSS